MVSPGGVAGRHHQFRPVLNLIMSNDGHALLTTKTNTNYYIVKWEPTGRTDNSWESKHYSTTVKLSSGDYVRLVGVHASGSNPYHMGGGHWGFFAGHLLG